MVRAGEEVLHQANHAAGETAANRVATRHREKDGHHERKVDDREITHPHRNENLDEECDQRNENESRPTKLINGDLLPGGQAGAIRHHPAAHGCGCSVAGGFAGWSEFAPGTCSGAGWTSLGTGVTATPFAAGGTLAGVAVFGFGGLVVAVPLGLAPGAVVVTAAGLLAEA